MNTKFIIEQIVMSMSFLKHTDFPDHKFIKQEDEHGMYKCLKTVINHPETGYLQEGIKHLATMFDSIKRTKTVNWSYVLDILAELKTKDNLEEFKEILENFHWFIVEKFRLPKPDLVLPRVEILIVDITTSQFVNALKNGRLTPDRFAKGFSTIMELDRRGQISVLIDEMGLPGSVLDSAVEVDDTGERTTFILEQCINHFFQNDKPSQDGIEIKNASQINIENCVGTGTRDDTTFVQQNLDKEYKETKMEEQFYTKLYFYIDVKRLLTPSSDSFSIKIIAECFNKLSERDKALVCHEFGITGCSPKHVPGIGVVLATMIVHTEMQTLKRKLSDVISHGYISELHTRIEQCTGWDDANKLHQYVQATFNGMPVENLKDIIVKYMSLENHDQFQHDGTQLAGFFAGLIYADAMTLVERKKGKMLGINPIHLGAVQDPIINPDTNRKEYVLSEDLTQPYVPNIHLQSYGKQLLKARQKADTDNNEFNLEDILSAIFGPNQAPTQENKESAVESIAHTHAPRIIIIKG